MEFMETEHGKFTNNKKTGQSAQEVYDEWLANKNKLSMPNELDLLKEQVATQQSIIDELLFEVIPSLLLTTEEIN